MRPFSPLTVPQRGFWSSVGMKISYFESQRIIFRFPSFFIQKCIDPQYLQTGRINSGYMAEWMLQRILSHLLYHFRSVTCNQMGGSVDVIIW